MYRQELYHGGKKGMKWGYNDGKANGKRTASVPGVLMGPDPDITIKTKKQRADEAEKYNEYYEESKERYIKNGESAIIAALKANADTEIAKLSNDSNIVLMVDKLLNTTLIGKDSIFKKRR